MKSIDLENRLVDFAVEIIELLAELQGNQINKIFIDQLSRSATSSALNYGEARSAESNRDFIHKIKVILKELRETFIGLKILKKSKIITDQLRLKKVMIENNELIAIFVKSSKTAQNKLKIK